MKLYIKNMVCNRCILVVKQELNKLNIEYGAVTLGEADIITHLTKDSLNKLGNNLAELGFDLLDDSKQQLMYRCLH
jgi:AraC family transcriptional regulator